MEIPKKRMFVGLASYKGGVGKTTSAIHIAGSLANRGRAVVLDGDRTKNSTAWHKDNKLPSDVSHPTLIGNIIDDYDYFVNDSMGSIDEGDLILLAKVSKVLLLPTTLDLLSLLAMRQTAEALRKNNLLEKTYVFFNRIKKTKMGPSKKLRDARSALEKFGFSVLETTIRENTAFQDAVQKGVLVQRLSVPNAILCGQDYEDLTVEFLEKIGEK